jgi:hypothetical protein
VETQENGKQSRPRRQELTERLANIEKRTLQESGLVLLGEAFVGGIMHGEGVAAAGFNRAFVAQVCKVVGRCILNYIS